MFNPQAWWVDDTATDLIRHKKVQPLIIVGIDNADKRDRPTEYLPFPDETPKPSVAEVHGEDYPRFLLDEVIPFVNREYRTDSNLAKLGLGGSST